MNRFAAFPGAALLAALLSVPGGVSVAQGGPAVAVGGAVLVSPHRVVPLAVPDRYLVRVEVPPSEAPVLGPGKDAPAHRTLRRLVATGQAAGNHGDLYDNRDRAHSRLPPGDFPQLTQVIYGPELRRAGWDYGLSTRLTFDAPLIGNSSTAQTGGALWRSQTRLALTLDGDAGAQALYGNYVAGQIHVYPEHRDHDPDHGDLIPANTPYLLTAQGSSGSDLPHLEALAMILAAFRPDTKAMLREAGLLAPTVQMVYRRSRAGVLSRADYLGGAAHPSVFDSEGIRLERMVGLASAITPEAVPPMVRLEVLEEMQAREGVDFFGEGLSETLFDTPSAIARVWRSRAGRRQMVVSAAGTRDPNGRGLRFDWVLLRGDPDRVRITPLDPEGRSARIGVDWQAPRPVPGAPGVTSPRIDIGVFAHNGVHDSAPAFVSILLPAHERRIYGRGPDGAPQPLVIDRSVPPGGYADPLIFPSMPWRDAYRYDAEGRFLGWTRRQGGQALDHDAGGRRVVGGRAAGLRYRLEPRAGQGPVVRAEITGGNGESGQD